MIYVLCNFSTTTNRGVDRCFSRHAYFQKGPHQYYVRHVEIFNCYIINMVEASSDRKQEIPRKIFVYVQKHIL